MRTARRLILALAVLYFGALVDTFVLPHHVPQDPSVCYDADDDVYLQCRDMWWVERDA